MIGVTEKLAQVKAFAAASARQYGRSPSAVQVLAVGKRHPAQRLREAYIAGQRAFGENYVTEAVEKLEALDDLAGISWHFIGQLQSNKSRAIAEKFQWMHTVDRLKIAQRLSQQRPHFSPPLNVCLQINIDGAPTKAGIQPADAAELAAAVTALPQLKLRGLMCMPDPVAASDDIRLPFRQTRALLESLNQELGISMDTLSMGMSGDLDAAIAEGATLVRVGTAIFGERNA